MTPRILAKKIETITELFECPISLEQSERPRSLSGCGHTFCADSLKKIKGNITCPICQKVSPRSVPNYLAVQLKSAFDNLSKALTPQATPSTQEFLGLVREGNSSVVKNLIEAKASVNGSDDTLNTALHHAAKNSDLAITRLLCDHKADVNALNSEGEAPLHLAAKQGHISIFQELLNRRAIDIKNNLGQTADELLTQKWQELQDNKKKKADDPRCCRTSRICGN